MRSKAYQLEVVSAEGRNGFPSVIFIHGVCHAAWCWHGFQEVFTSRGIPSYALSLRGHGASEGVEDLRWASIEDFVADVHIVAVGLPEPPILVGHSIGTWIAQHYAARYPVSGLVLMASLPPTGAWGITGRLIAQHPLVFARINAKLNVGEFVPTEKLCREIFFRPDTPDEIVQACFNRLERRESYRAFLDMLLAFPDRRLIGCPVLVMSGTQDWCFSLHEVMATAKAFRVMPHLYVAGHDLMLEPGFELIAQEVARWILGLQ